MIACLLARDLGLEKIIVPPASRGVSAYGGLIADVRNDFIQTAMVDLDDAEVGLKSGLEGCASGH